mmetsp:Transcript_146053/g.468401  ORF Transcript_146053/g.468401 Transcript_146053/m.468401 type:complete len:83 (-) Transcript_146053:346-594(-)
MWRPRKRRSRELLPAAQVTLPQPASGDAMARQSARVPAAQTERQRPAPASPGYATAVPCAMAGWDCLAMQHPNKNAPQHWDW